MVLILIEFDTVPCNINLKWDISVKLKISYHRNMK